MLDVKSLTVRYGRVTAVDGVDLQVRKGEIVSLVGPNGAGKSTTLAAVMGGIRPQAGQILFENRPLDGIQTEDIVRLGASLVPEGRHVLGTLTVAENLRLGMTTRDKGPEADADLKAMLARFPVLEKYYDALASRLSGGEQQQMVIARALLSNPRLLMLDEPSLGLAPQVVDSIFDLLAELRDSGVTILLVEQNALRAAELADRVYLMAGGRIVTTGPGRDFAESDDFASAYFGVEG